jgi:hypothetical protein
MLSHPDDMKAAIANAELWLCREIGASAALRLFVAREVMPGNLKGAALENFVRDGALTYWHPTCSAKMGRDAMSVVDGNLKVYGIDNLRIADGSVMPRVTTGNTNEVAYSEARAGKKTVALTMLSSVGMALGPLVGGWVFDTYHDYRWLHIGSFVLAVGAAAIAVAFPTPSNQPAARPAAS